jgi:citrate transporter
VLPLVAGLFVLVEALAKTGLIDTIATLLHDGAQRSVLWTAAVAGVFVAFASNLINNLPAGLIAGSAVQAGPISDQVARAIVIGVDLGPNLSVNRLTRDHPVACGAAPRRPFGRPWRLPENRSRGDATGADPGAGGGIAAEMSTNHRANGWRIRGMALMVDDVAPLEAIRVL